MSDLTSFLNHPIDTLEKALHIRRKIDQLNEAMKELFGLTPAIHAREAQELASTEPTKRRGRRKMSATSCTKMAAAQKARWAKKNGEKPTTERVSVKPAPLLKAKKGGMSAEGRAKIVAAQKARWAKVKAEKAGSAPAKATAPDKTPKAKAVAPKKKRTLSPEGRAKIVAALKARWAKAKKGK